MKFSIRIYFLSLFIAACICSCTINAQNTNVYSPAFNQKLEMLLTQKEYFLLEVQLEKLKDSIAEKEKHYYECFINNAFNENEKVVSGVDDFFLKYSNELTDSVKAKLLLLQADSYFKQFEYAKAAITDSLVLSRYSLSLNKSTVNETKNNLLAANALRNIPPQQVIIKEDANIRWKKDKLNLIEIPVKFNTEDQYAVFDTKANYSCITQTDALKLGLKLLAVSIEEGSGLTGIKFKNSLAVADSLSVGNILIRNAVFLVMPDDKLDFGAFSIHVIIGFPVIQQLKEIHFYKDHRMIVPLVPSKSNLHNLALDGPNPVLSIRTGDDTLRFHLDLGAVNTYLYSAYFERYKTTILRDGKSKTLNMGGAGGSRKRNAYMIPKIDFTIGDKTTSLYKIYIITEQINSTDGYYGNLGNDLTDKFEEFTLNFKYMFFKVE